MPETLDIQEVIKKSTSEVSLQDLSRKGFKNVKVLNQATISKLIAEAVDRVIAVRQKEIGETERQRVILESQKEFNTLAKERLEEQALVAQIKADNACLKAEVEILRKRLEAQVEVQAQRDQALRQQENLERHLEEMRQALLEAERAVAEYEGQLAAKNEEIGRLSHSAAEIVERVSADLGKRLESIEKKTATDEDLKRSLEEIQRDISNIATVSAVVRKGEAIDAATMVKFAERGSEDSSVESNIAQVKVKQAKASGLKSTLARLKELQKGAQNDGQ